MLDQNTNETIEEAVNDTPFTVRREAIAQEIFDRWFLSGLPVDIPTSVMTRMANAIANEGFTSPTLFAMMDDERIKAIPAFGRKCFYALRVLYPSGQMANSYKAHPQTTDAAATPVAVPKKKTASELRKLKKELSEQQDLNVTQARKIYELAKKCEDDVARLYALRREDAEIYDKAARAWKTELEDIKTKYMLLMEHVIFGTDVSAEEK